jgi:hypothetical protein
MATALQYSYANLSLLFARFHAKTIPWGRHKNTDFVALGFQGSDENEYEEYVDTRHHALQYSFNIPYNLRGIIA